MYSENTKADTVTILDEEKHINIAILDAGERRNRLLYFVTVKN